MTEPLGPPVGICRPPGGVYDQLGAAELAVLFAPLAIPTGGTTGQVLTKDSDTDYSVDWFTPVTYQSIPAGGTTGQVLTKQSATSYAVEWATPTPLPTDHIVGDGVHKITVGPTAPVNPQVGDLWLDTGV